jgi:hypothetical protein
MIGPAGNQRVIMRVRTYKYRILEIAYKTLLNEGFTSAVFFLRAVMAMAMLKLYSCWSKQYKDKEVWNNIFSAYTHHFFRRCVR